MVPYDRLYGVYKIDKTIREVGREKINLFEKDLDELFAVRDTTEAQIPKGTDRAFV